MRIATSPQGVLHRTLDLPAYGKVYGAPYRPRVAPGAAHDRPPSPQPTRPRRPVGSVQQRQDRLPEPLRALHRRLLAGFLTHAGPPKPAAVADLAVKLRLDPDQALGALAAADLVHHDPASGMIDLADPFSGRPTLHQVELAGGPTVSAMCALDALGIPR